MCQTKRDCRGIENCVRQNVIVGGRVRNVSDKA